MPRAALPRNDSYDSRQESDNARRDVGGEYRVGYGGVGTRLYHAPPPR